MLLRALVGVVAAAIVPATGCRTDPSRVLWPRTAEFEQAVREFRIPPNEAYNIAASAARSEHELVASEPLFVWRGRYAFGHPRKFDTWIRGYYVDGNTGRVEFRESARRISTESRLVDGDWTIVRDIPVSD